MTEHIAHIRQPLLPNLWWVGCTREGGIVVGWLGSRFYFALSLSAAGHLTPSRASDSLSADNARSGHNCDEGSFHALRKLVPRLLMKSWENAI